MIITHTAGPVVTHTGCIAFDLNDTLFPTGACVRALTERMYANKIFSLPTHVDAYEITKLLLKYNQITQSEYDSIMYTAHIQSMSMPYTHVVQYIQSLIQTDVHFVTSRKIAYDHAQIHSILSSLFTTKIVHVHNPGTHVDTHGGFIASNLAKKDILTQLYNMHNIRMFVDDLPFLHKDLKAIGIDLVLMSQPWSDSMCVRTHTVVEYKCA